MGNGLKRRFGRIGKFGGFTIIELLVVIAVIGILVLVATLSFQQYQAETRDANRDSKITVIAEALESYYDEKGEYPGCTALQAPADTVASSTLKGIDLGALVAPLAPSGTTNSLLCTNLTQNGTDFYEYKGDGSNTCSNGASCLSFVLRYKDENDGTIKEIPSRRNASIATSGASTLTVSNVSFTQVTLTWTPVENAASYELDTNGTASPQTGTTVTLTGLTKGTAYTFKLRPVTSAGSGGSWSNTVGATTLELVTPTISSMTANSTSAYTVNWGSISNATEYTVQCSTDNATWGSGCQATTSSTSQQFTGASAGTRYYARVQAVNTTAPGGPHTSDWSASANTYTSVNAPAPYTISSSYPAWNTIQATSNAICSPGTTAEYVWFVNGSVWSGATAKTVTYTMSWNQTITLTVNTRCTVGGQYSGYTAASNNASRTLTGPSAWAGNCAYRTACWDGSCPAGTTSSYIHWWVNSSIFGTTGSNAGVGYGTWYYNGAAWGNGDVRSTTYCSGPWGTVTAGGWGPFGSGCLPTITSSWCTA